MISNAHTGGNTMAKMTIQTAARKHGVVKSSVLWQVKRHPERFNAERIEEVNRFGLWLIDDECQGFKQWLVSHRQEKPKQQTKLQDYQRDYYHKYTKPKRDAERKAKEQAKGK